MECGIIPPRHEDIVRCHDDGYLPECIRKEGHLEPHLIKTPEGKFIAWEDDYECDCCGPCEEDRCYTYKEITPEEALKLLLKDWPCP